MTDLFLLSEAQMRRIEPYFPLSHGIARVDDRRIVSAHHLRDQEWASLARRAGASMARTRRSTTGSFAGAGWACSTRFSPSWRAKGGKPERIMIDATHLKAHRTAASLLKKGLFPDVSGAPKAA